MKELHHTKHKYINICIYIYVVAWWHHQMETFSAKLVLCEKNTPVNGGFLHKGQWRGALMFSLIYALNKRLRKERRRRWFETSSRSLWRHCIGINVMCVFWCYTPRTVVRIKHRSDHQAVSNRRSSDFVQRLVKTDNKENAKAHIAGLCVGNALFTGGFPQGPVTRKSIPLREDFMYYSCQFHALQPCLFVTD